MIEERKGATVGVTMDTAFLKGFMIAKGAYKHAETEIFRLASGATSKYYIDCKIALSFADFRRAIGSLIFGMIRESNIKAVGGLAVGAYPIAIAVSDAAHQGGQEMTAFVVRKEPKDHGLEKYVEGHVEAGSRVLIVEDVTTSGRSTIHAIERSRDAGLNVVQVIALIDREEADGKRNIEAAGVPFRSLLTLKELQAYSVAA